MPSTWISSRPVAAIPLNVSLFDIGYEDLVLEGEEEKGKECSMTFDPALSCAFALLPLPSSGVPLLRFAFILPCTKMNFGSSSIDLRDQKSSTLLPNFSIFKIQDGREQRNPSKSISCFFRCTN